jgi:hypothetical protein
MSEAHNQQEDLWVDVPEPEEIDDKEVHASLSTSTRKASLTSCLGSRCGQQRVRSFVRINCQKVRELGATPRSMQLLLDHEAQATAVALDTERQTRRSTRHSIQVLT